jgi:hypothetical protein
VNLIQVSADIVFVIVKRAQKMFSFGGWGREGVLCGGVLFGVSFWRELWLRGIGSCEKGGGEWFEIDGTREFLEG